MAKRKKGRGLGSPASVHRRSAAEHARNVTQDAIVIREDISAGRCTKAFDKIRSARAEVGKSRANGGGDDLRRAVDKLEAQESRFVGRCVR